MRRIKFDFFFLRKVIYNESRGGADLERGKEPRRLKKVENGGEVHHFNDGKGRHFTGIGKLNILESSHLLPISFELRPQ